MIGAPADITIDWLRGRLEASGRSGDLTSARVTRSIQGSSGTIHFIEAVGVRTLPSELVLKVYHPNRFLAGLNEVLFYRDFFPNGRFIPAPEPLDACIDVDHNYCHVLTRDLTPTHQMCDRRRLAEQARPIVRTLARLHAQWWDSDLLSRGVMLVPQDGGVSFIQATSRAVIEQKALWVMDELIPAFCTRFREHLPSEWERLFEAAAGSWPDLYGRRVDGRAGLTLLHGDTNWENIFLARSPDASLRFIDWETFKCGPAAYDVAYLLICARSVSQRRAIESRVLDWYLEALDEEGGVVYSRDQLLADYRLSVVANLFVALAWGRFQAVRDAMCAFVDWGGPSLVM